MMTVYLILNILIFDIFKSMFLSMLEDSVISRISGGRKMGKKREYLNCYEKICHLEFASK